MGAENSWVNGLGNNGTNTMLQKLFYSSNFSQAAMVNFDFFGNVYIYIKKDNKYQRKDGGGNCDVVQESTVKITSFFNILFQICLIFLSHFSLLVIRTLLDN